MREKNKNLLIPETAPSMPEVLVTEKNKADRSELITAEYGASLTYDKETNLWTSSLDGQRWISPVGADKAYKIRPDIFERQNTNTTIINGEGTTKLYKFEEALNAIQEYFSLPRCNKETNIYTDTAGIQWAPAGYYIKEYPGITHMLLKTMFKKYTYLDGLDSRNAPNKLYPLLGLSQEITRYLSLPKVDESTNIYTDPEQHQWAPTKYFVDTLGIGYEGFFVRIDPEKSRNFGKTKKKKDGVTCLVKKIRGISLRDEGDFYEVAKTTELLQKFLDLPKPDADTNIYTDPAGRKFAPQPYFEKNVTGAYRGQTKGVLAPATKIPGRDINNRPTVLYDVEEGLKLVQDYVGLPKVDSETNIFTDIDSVCWAPAIYFVEYYGIAYDDFYSYVDKDKSKSDNFIGADVRRLTGKDKKGIKRELYNMNEASKILQQNGYSKKIIDALTKEREKKLPRVDKENGVYIDETGKSFIPLKLFQSRYGISIEVLQYYGKIPFITGRDMRGHETQLFELEPALLIKEKYSLLPYPDKETDLYTDTLQEQWATEAHLGKIKIVVTSLPPKFLSRIRILSGRDLTGAPAKLYNIKDVQEVQKLRKVDLKKFIHTDENGQMWAGIRYFADKYGMTHSDANYILKKYNIAVLENFFINPIIKLFNLAEAKKVFEQAEEKKVNKTLIVIENEDKKNVRNFINEVAENNSELAKRLKTLISVFGASRCVDLIFKFRPDFRGIPVEYIKGVIADYLGDFLVVKAKFNPGDTEIPAEYLADDNLRAGLYETIKDNCLRYYFDEKRAGTHRAPIEIIYDYIDHISEALGATRSHEIDDVIQDVVAYYDAALTAFHKPEKFVDALSANREFPDINQRINMKELADKKRLLIADEMGLGKSASVIMAKENLGISCAVVVAPKNVVSTWERYLSDRNAAGGYFKSGQAPRVLVIDGPQTFVGVAGGQYDYILISQEKMNERYVPELKRIGFDMLIVDEVHKVKSVTGERTKYLLDLAKTVEDDDKYLAMLSGTPVPNKVQDLAIILRLLYPDKFREIDDNELVSQIIRGNMAELRSTLLPRMQMKSLEEGIEMPKLTENITEVELTELEKEIYQVLLEDDELTATEKMQVLRQAVLNPELLDSTPNIEGSKIKTVSIALSEAFGQHDRIVMFVNGYIEGIVRGEQSIVDKLSLPPGVEIKVVHGNISDAERSVIQTKFNAKNGHKILLIVSGQTADVGVDYSGGDRVFFYNEPWTEYQRHQELARVYRPGLQHDLEATTFVTRGTIEEGIHEYIKRKYLAIEKLLRGIPLSELEKMLLEKTEKTSTDENLEKNPELAEYYFSSWDKLRRMFGHVKNIGEEKFIDFLQTYGEEYANAYVDIGSRAYQANANRIAGTLIGQFIKERDQHPEDMRILDLASGPEMLKRHIVEEHQKRMVSLDINRHHFKPAGERRVVGSALHLPFGNHSFEYANFALSLHYLNFAPTREQYERTQALAEINRVLKPGGRAVINIIYSLEFKDQTKFAAAANALGFKIVDAYTGEVTVDEQYRSFTVTLEKEHDLETQEPKELTEKIGAENYAGLKFRKNNTKIKNQRKIATSFSMRDQKIKIPLNKEDSLVLEEETAVIALAESLKEHYHGIKNIPDAQIVTNNFVRVLAGKKYVLFKKLERGNGAVVIK